MLDCFSQEHPAQRRENRNAAVRKAASKIMLHGGLKDANLHHAQWQPHCEKPVPVHMATHARGDGRQSAEIALKAPCRKCELCLAIKKLTWQTRVSVEMSRTPYNYFCTLTYSDLHLAGCMMASDAYRGADDEQRLQRSMYHHVQLFFKRLRKGRSAAAKERGLARFSGSRAERRWYERRQLFSPLSFRYFAIFELGSKTNRPHYHLILHSERWLDPQILSSEWRSRSEFDLVRTPDRAASYLSKYVTKSHLVRPKASQEYGYVPAPPRTLDPEAFI